MWYNNGRAIITFQWPGRVVRFAYRPMANYTITLALHGIIPTKVAATGRAAIPFPKANRELTEHNAILKEAQYKLWKDRTKP